MPAFPSRRHPDDLHRRGGWCVVARGRCTARRSHRRFGSVAYSAGLFCAAGGGSCSCSCCYCCCRPTHREQFCSDLACSGCLRFGYPACFGRSVLCLQRVSGCSPTTDLSVRAFLCLVGTALCLVIPFRDLFTMCVIPHAYSFRSRVVLAICQRFMSILRFNIAASPAVSLTCLPLPWQSYT
jgi:hypothetical protein